MPIADLLAELDPDGLDEPIEVSSHDFDMEPLRGLPEGAALSLIESEWPELLISRDGPRVLCEISEHIYTKYWWHKYHARVFCEAMVRAVRRLIAEGAPFEPAVLDDDDEVHLFVRWKVVCDEGTPGREVISRAKESFDLVWERTNRMLDDSDSVLVLGKDTGPHLVRLEEIAATLFRLTWRSVDTSLGPNREGAIRVEEQTRSRLVGGKKWTPKNGRFRVVPLSPRAREIIADLRRRANPSPEDQVIPNVEGCPYVRLQSAGKGSGTAAWRVLKEAMGHSVRWHSLRHLFAVRCLQRGIPITVVSQWMGHSDVNLTVKRYGRFAAEAKEQFAWINALGQPVEALAEGRKPRLEVAR